MQAAEFTGDLFDGESSAAAKVFVTFYDDRSLHLRGVPSGDRSLEPENYKISLPVGRSPIRIRTESGEMIEFAYSEELVQTLQKQSSPLTNLLAHSDKTLRYAFALIVFAIGICYLAYAYALPLATHLIRPFIGYSLKEKVGNSAIYTLDNILFKESSLAPERQQAVMQILSGLSQASGYNHQLDLKLRSMKKSNLEIQNAFAILPNNVIVTDALAKNLDDSEIEAVLAHEVGHLALDHGTEVMLRASMMSVLSFLFFGSEPTTTASVAIVLADAKHSQEEESAADYYGVMLLKKMHKDPLALKRALEKLTEGASETMLEEYLSSHPLTSERVRVIEGLSK